MQIDYCESCQRRVTEHDISVGLATFIQNQIFCRACVDKLGLIPPKPMVPVSAKEARSSGTLKAIGTDSGLHKAKPAGSGLRKSPSPGSGIQKAAGTGSGVHKAGSGIRQTPSPGSGVRKAASSSSVLGRIPGSGIHQVSGSKPSSGTKHRLPGRNRKLYLRVRQDSGNLWIAVLGVLVGLTTGALLYFLLIPK